MTNTFNMKTVETEKVQRKYSLLSLFFLNECYIIVDMYCFVTSKAILCVCVLRIKNGFLIMRMSFLENF